MSTLDRIQAWHKRINGHRCEVVQMAATYGFRCAANRAFGARDESMPVKIGLELDLLEAPKDPLGLLVLKAKWNHYLDVMHRKRDRVYEIQAKYGVSGIEWEEFCVSGVSIRYPWIGDDLRWIDADLSISSKYRWSVLGFFLARVAELELRVFKRRETPQGKPYRMEDDDWDEIERGSESAYLSGFVVGADWCHVWGDESELSVNIGRGLEPDTGGASVWFCASKEVPAI